MLEYSLDISLTDKEYESTDVQGLIEPANQALTFCNDIYSFEKELRDQNEDLNQIRANTVAFIMNEQGANIGESLDKVRVLFDEAEERIHYFSEKLLNNPMVSKEVKIFANGVQYLEGGHWYSYKHDKRYNDI